MPGVERIVHSHKRDYIKGLARLARSRRSASAQPGQSTRRAVRGRGRTVHLLDDAGPWAHARAAAEVLIDQATARPV